MDIIDYQILDILKKNSRSTASEISKQVHLSLPAVSERIKKMEENNIIEKYSILLNRKEMNYNVLAFIHISIDGSENIEEFRKLICYYPFVLECHHITGDYDYLLKVLTKDIEELEIFLSSQLKKIKGIVKSNTAISLASLKEEINV